MRTSALRAGATSLAVCAAVAAVHGGALRHPFLASHDDGAYVIENPVIRAPPAEAIRGAFTTTPLGAWAPLHLLSHALDHALWGDWAGGYVLGNLVLHALSSVLLGWLVLRLGGPPLAAAAAALVFAVHPVQVESVVWVSQRKAVLSMAFLLASLHAWISYAGAEGRRRLLPYALALAAGAAALLSKAVAVVLPAALALVDVPLRRARPRAAWVLEKLPFVALAAAVAAITVLAKEEIGTEVTVAGHTRAAAPGGLAYHGGGPLGTFFTMATVLPRYVKLLLWPSGLSAIYLPPIHPGLDLEVAASLALLAALAGLGVFLAIRAPRLFAWTGLFFLGLLPVSQLVPQVTLMNDRYLYVPMLGAAALAGEKLAAAWRRSGRPGRTALGVVALAALCALGATARARVDVWRSDLALWTDAAAKADRSPTAWYNLARARQAVGDEDGALQGYLRAVALDDQDADAAVNAGAIYLRRTDLARAEPLVAAGARLAPGSLEAQFNLALLRLQQGRYAAAEAPLERALALDPAACPPALLAARARALAGREAEALATYRAAERRGCADEELRRWAEGAGAAALP